MSIWVDILQSAGAGDTDRALILLRQGLPLSLRSFVYGPSCERYAGPLPRAVRKFIKDLNEPERTLAASHQDEFIDYIVDSVVEQVEQTLIFTVALHTRELVSLADLVAVYPWNVGLKRDVSWKTERVADLICSMNQQGIPVPTTVLEIVKGQGAAKFQFNEEAAAKSANRLKLSWADFRNTIEHEVGYLCLVEEENRDTAEHEGMDYGVVTIAKVMLHAGYGVEPEVMLDLMDLGAAVSRDLTALLREFHSEKPRDGYPPIARHRVFWDVSSEYEGLRLTVEMEDPFIEKDEELGNFIGVRYPDVVGTSRPVILRRRRALAEACASAVHRHFNEIADRLNSSTPKSHM